MCANIGPLCSVSLHRLIHVERCPGDQRGRIRIGHIQPSGRTLTGRRCDYIIDHDNTIDTIQLASFERDLVERKLDVMHVQISNYN